MKRRYLIVSDTFSEDFQARETAGIIDRSIRRHCVGGGDPDVVETAVFTLGGETSGLEREILGSDTVIYATGRFDLMNLFGSNADALAAKCSECGRTLKVICEESAVGAKLWKKAGIADVAVLSELGIGFMDLDSLVVAGCDEAGRGCLAGPVFAAAVILPSDFYHPLLNDSKQMTEKQRDELRVIIEREAVAWKVTAVDAEEIDRINILNASIAGMQRSLDGLTVRPQCILVDGNRFKPYTTPDGVGIPHHCVVHGDAVMSAISAASVLAKTHRDEYMRTFAKEYPQYGWDHNMAYPTADHKEAIRKYGITPLHRKSYKLD